MPGFFKDLEGWQTGQKSISEFVQKEHQPFKSILVHFENKDDIAQFSKLLRQNINERTQLIYFPKYKHNQQDKK